MAVLSALTHFWPRLPILSDPTYVGATQVLATMGEVMGWVNRVPVVWVNLASARTA